MTPDLINTLLLNTISNNVEKLQKLLLSNQISVNAQDELKHSAFKFACVHRYMDMIDYLMTLPDLNVNIQDAKHQTPLMRACQENHMGVVAKLLTHPHIKLNVRDVTGKTAIDLAKNTDIIALIKNEKVKQLAQLEKMQDVLTSMTPDELLDKDNKVLLDTYAVHKGLDGLFKTQNQAGQQALYAIYQDKINTNIITRIRVNRAMQPAQQKVSDRYLALATQHIKG